MTTLPPLNLEAKCPKCGHDVIVTQYHERESIWNEKLDYGTGEHMDRTCGRCKDTWYEECLDAQDNGGAR